MTFDETFMRLFEREVHEAYVRNGSKLRGTVRTTSCTKGSEAKFEGVGGSAQIRTFNLTDTYHGEWVVDIGALRIDGDERRVFANAAAFGLGRATDRQIVEKLALGECLQGDGPLTMSRIEEILETMATREIPDDGDRCALVGWKQWSELMSIASFANACELGGSSSRRWLGMRWIPHSGLPLRSAARMCFWYHKRAVGHAIGAGIKMDISWHKDRDAHYVTHSLAQEATLIEPAKIVRIECDE